MNRGWVLSRRLLRAVWVLCWALGVGACAHPATTEQCATPEEGGIPWQPLAPGVWVWGGDGGDITAGNAGHVAPTSLVLAGNQAVVIDPGPSHRHGARVRRSVACRFEAEVRWVVNTHAHAENVLGNSAFEAAVARDQTQVVASAATQQAMQDRCPDCLASLTDRVGVIAMAGTRIVLPTRALSPGDRLPLGRETLQVLAVEQGHSEGDLVLWWPERRVLWAGGLVYGQRIPELSQGRVDGWLQALNRLEALRPVYVVGASVSSVAEPDRLPPALTDTRAYLQALRAGVLRAMDEGRQPQEAGLVPLPAFAHWAGYAERHAFNVQRAWRELEPVWMEQGPGGLPSVQDVGR